MIRPGKILGSAVIAAAIALHGCGGGGGGPPVRPDPPAPPPTVRPDPPAPPPTVRPDPPSAPLVRPGGSLPSSYRGPTLDQDGAEYYTVDRIGVPGAYAYPGGDAIRIGIQDDAVDFTHPDFRGRIELEGASFAYRRLRLIDEPAPDAFDHCEASNRCRIYLVDSTGDRSSIEALARTVLEELEEQGLPQDANRWYLYDIAEDGFGWFELPALGLDDPVPGAQHGTGVASVAARQAPDAVLVPMATNFDERYEITFELPRGTNLHVQDDPYLEDSYLELTDSDSVAEIDRTLAAAWRRWYDSADIINSSFSTDVDLSTSEGRQTRDSEFARMRTLNVHLPERWKAHTQIDRPEGERTIRVLAAGNMRNEAGDDARSLKALVLYEFEELWGHNVVATALNEVETALADYANICGNRPTNWDTNRHGRHFCLVAPGTHRIAVPGGIYEDDFLGTSYAAPYVSAVLARMMARSRGQVGNTELVKRMMDTADNTGVFDDQRLYGAGVVDPDAALNAVGTPTTGTSRNRAAIGSTTLRLPSAYGDAAQHVAGTEIASFDAWNFPFWTPANELIENGGHPIDPIPDFTETDRADGCFVTNGYAPDAVCVPPAPASGRGSRFAGAGHGAATGGVSGLVAADGAGASVRLSESVTVAGFTRSAGRLDGQATGAFSFAGGSSLGAVHFARSRAMDDAGRWRLDGRFTFAFDVPQGIGRSEGSMFEAGPALLSSWTLGLTHTGEDVRTKLAVSQPPRAESGTGRLTYPSGRRLDGTHVLESRTFSLRPTRRMVTTALTHQRPFAAGEAMVIVYRADNQGHTAAAPDHGGGIAWRLVF